MAEGWCCADKTCIVTGGASGIGALNVQWFLREGARVAILDVAEEKGKELQTRLNLLYTGKVLFYKCDMTDEEQISRAFDRVVEDFKRVDIIINNAGIFADTPNVWRRACDVNWQGVVSLTLKGIKHMRKDQGGEGGTIINVSSVAALVRFPYLPIYNGSKAAVLHFSQTISLNPFFETTGVRILVMCYGATDTSLLSNIENKTWDEVLGKNVTKMVAPAVPVQRAESAAAALYSMYKKAANGSIWLSVNDKEGKDITSTVDAAFKNFENILNKHTAIWRKIKMSGHWDLKNKTFLVTGGASGLGALYTEWLLREGVKSIAILDVAADKGEELTAKLNTIYPGKVAFYQCDVGDEAQLSDVFERVLKNVGKLDAIINNAGIMNDSPENWRKSVDVNWRGLVSLTLKGVEHMRVDEGGAGGTILNVSSTAALVRTTFLPIYCGSKAAVLQFGLSLSMPPFYENTGVRILTFCLGATNTPLLDNLGSRCWDEKTKKDIVDYLSTEVDVQKAESAADAIVKIIKEGDNGSIWLSVSDKPASDITSQIDAGFKAFEAIAHG
ncbi:uncharacterized protein [Epargyreus clarus]|uniref:uncharacterized protein n=1 Tax=Epargyreus clarus TaxID=520877 RepID=UPI003C30DAB4